MNRKPVRVERVVARHFGGRNERKGEAEVLRLLQEGPGIRFSESGPSSWSQRLDKANQAMVDLCDFSAMELRDKRLDLIVTVDAGGNTLLLAETLAARTRLLCHHPVGVYAVGFAKEVGETRTRRVISYDGDPRAVIPGKRIFLYGDVLEYHCYVLRLAKEIAIFGRRALAAGHPKLVPKIVGIGAAVIRDFGIKEHVKDLLGVVPELHYLAHARRQPRQSSCSEQSASIFSFDQIRQERRPAVLPKPEKNSATG